jgi:hypothetical protein
MAPESAKMPAGEQWGRGLIEPGRGVAPAVLTSANLETVRFVVVSEVNDFEPDSRSRQLRQFDLRSIAAARADAG